MIVALLALFIALSGTSYAAISVANNSVGSPQIKPGGVKTSDLGNNAVNSKKVKNQSLTAKDLKPAVTQAQRPLASGKTMRGFFTAGSGDAATGYIGEGLTFPHALPATFVKGNVEYIDGAPSANCPGSGQAAPGWACFYEGQNSGADLCCIYDEDYDSNAVGTYGARIYWFMNAAGFADGDWAITAP